MLQIALGKSDLHPHRFKVHGGEYDDWQVALGGLSLRPGERFVCVYDDGDQWRHDIRTAVAPSRPPAEAHA